MDASIVRGAYTKGGSPTGGDVISYDDSGEASVLAAFAKKNDFVAERIKHLMALPDLTRKSHSPLKFIIDKILAMPDFRGFDIVVTPETVTIKNGFDPLNIPADHPSRKTTDTYFVSADRVLRTQTTVMWTYYMNDSDIRRKLEQNGRLRSLSYGKVYRKDEIDRNHFPVFHQIDGLYLARVKDEYITLDTLKSVLEDIIKAIFGKDIEFRFLDDTFPFTDPSTQIEIKRGEGWLEVLGGGIVHRNVLKNFGLDPEVYNGWAFGFGLERLAMIKNGIPDIRSLWSEDPRITRQFANIDSTFKEVSKYPPITRDISFIVKNDFVPNDYFDLIRDLGGDLVEEVSLLDKYENTEKFGAGKVSYTYRVIYRSMDRTLTTQEVDAIQEKIVHATEEKFSAEVR